MLYLLMSEIYEIYTRNNTKSEFLFQQQKANKQTPTKTHTHKNKKKQTNPQNKTKETNKAFRDISHCAQKGSRKTDKGIR